MLEQLVVVATGCKDLMPLSSDYVFIPPFLLALLRNPVKRFLFREGSQPAFMLVHIKAKQWSVGGDDDDDAFLFYVLRIPVILESEGPQRWTTQMAVVLLCIVMGRTHWLFMIFVRLIYLFENVSKPHDPVRTWSWNECYFTADISWHVSQRMLTCD